MKLLFEKSRKGRKAFSLPDFAWAEKNGSGFSKERLRMDIGLPELSELDIVRHFTELSRRNFGVDNGFYPLGSCTMKYNPKINEDIARLEGFTNVHPLQEEGDVQGCLHLMHELDKLLCEITGMGAFSLQPAAGAHGELTGLMIVKKYFELRKEKRGKVISPDSSHGTNPASASMAGFETVTVSSGRDGMVDLESLKKALDKDVAAIMLTNPNTLGLFEKDILKITALAHENGSLCYYDGANLNAIMGIARPGDMGFDIIHLNLHKSFSTPHGCGGPGSGPVGVTDELSDILPVPRVKKIDGSYTLDDASRKTIGRVKSFYGNFSVLVKAYSYIAALGADGLRRVSENAVLNANYLKEKLKDRFHLPYDVTCMHEFVLSDQDMPNGVKTSDIAKRLLDYGMHPPTIYFPLIVHGAMMIEPNETESIETLDSFYDAMVVIADEAEDNPEKLKKAPLNMPVGRLDAVSAARNPDGCWKG